MNGRLFSATLAVIVFGAAFFPFGDRNLIDMRSTVVLGQDWITRTNRSLLETLIMQAHTEELNGELVLAAAHYEEALNTTDPDSEFPDLRGRAGIGLATVNLKRDRKDDAISALRKILTIKGCPDSIKATARQVLHKLGAEE